MKETFIKVSFKESSKTAYTYKEEEYVSNPRWQLLEQLFNANYTNKVINGQIPKKIHQIWLGGKFPKKYHKIQESWKRFHPDWEYYLWTDKEVKKLEMINRELFSRTSNYGAKSDILRYEILNQFGGLYVDTDFECFHPFDTIHEQCHFFAGLVYSEAPLLNNALIGSVAGHPVLKLCIDSLNTRIKEIDTTDPDSIMHNTGPQFFNECFFQTITAVQENVIPFPITYFYPLPNGERFLTNEEKIKSYIKPESFALHYWYVSWFDNTLKSRIIRKIKKTFKIK
ncbi:MAG: hypothetical protein DKM50_02645 [Candidatus Margulisiibacteriota bacterium]|nr:MAG: hypothetical protein A2X43_03580 [Candidatus Margulisbacteria bacterium GWD2_39_127]OGI02506.1 MAG: hypothetical protein A2X42_07465 [Candidatus Margulisbacteria bacterium GWF2_38_17]OGI10999.1 MAG: hypothetical protein A2X41_01990 [Candidatus Margulisbacteria bacterium GWE2_39_32]PZM83191.1 MAG: hypothetical protein DKM50_02645 [Candidatus Margulisiibacteriota bacterium]HAR62504.1 hypothetical protein [Candidatus Margulisiibacteriota bacterium]